MSVGRAVATSCVVSIALALVGCSDDGSTAQTTAASSTAAPSTTSEATTTVAATTTTLAPETTPAPTPAPTEAPTTVASTVPSATACPGGTPLPATATNLVAINGDIDGDTVDDVVTSYTLDGVPYVHATLASGGESDAAVPTGNADTVSINFMDFDHAGGATTPPPMAVLSIGASKAGTAVATFLTLTPQYCIRVWHNNLTDDTLFTFRISAEPIYQGLMCDGAAGSIIHSLTTAEQSASGDWNITLQPFGHDFTTVELHDIETLTVPDGANVQQQFGDMTTCGITLFP